MKHGDGRKLYRSPITQLVVVAILSAFGSCAMLISGQIGEAFTFTGWLRWTIYLLLGFWAILATVLFGWIFVLQPIAHVITSARNKRFYPAPGTMVRINTHHLHLYCQGEGSPTVILDAGGGECILDWSLVQPEVARFARVCAYDRAGYGWSDPGPLPRTSQQLVNELYALLQAASIQGPYILVGQELGGLNMRLFAIQHPIDVAGMVMVNSTHENELEKVAPIFWYTSGDLNALRVLARLRRWGILRPSITEKLASRPHLKPSVNKTRQWLMSRSQVFETFYQELVVIEDNLRQMQNAGPLPDVPMIALTRGLYDTGDIPSDVSLEELKVAWEGLQTELSTRVSESKYTVAEQSGGYIHQSQPELVINAIRQVVEAVRTCKRLSEIEDHVDTD